MKSIILTFIFTFSVVFAHSQVVTTQPEIFTDNDPVTITFHADLGTAGLANYTGDVYAHTGVITDKSSSWTYVIAGWNENTEKAKLTKVAENEYQLIIEPSVREFYGVPDGEKILQLAFVFRNADGSKEGKGTGGTDIFINVSEAGVALKVNSPQPNQVFELNETIHFDITAAQNDSINLFIDDIQVAGIKGENLTYSFDTSVSKLYKIEAIASTLDTTVSEVFNIFVKGTVPIAEMPAGARKGIEYTGATSVRLVLFAPKKEMVFLIGDFNDWNLSNDYLMNKSGDYFWIELTGLESGKEYGFQYYVDGEIFIPDPYAEKILDPWNDKSIPDETYPGLKAYPDGKTTNLVSVFQTSQQPYSWKINNFTPPPDSNLVIYELLIRDFTEGPEKKEGNIKGVMSKMNYLDSLNINAIELMPFNEFEGNNSWGYNPAMYFAPDKAYGTEEDYKKLIDSLHFRGIAVIMDIVLNHSYGQSPLVRMYFEGSKPSADNPWYNADCPNTVYCWGYDFNHESIHTQEFVDSVLHYWIKEYKVDGFRFDFTKGFTNTKNDGGAYDASRIAILKRMADQVKAVKNDVILILEHFADNSEEKVLETYGFLIWGNINYSYNEATMGYHENNKSDFSNVSYKKRGWTNPYLVGYMESHDEERLMYKNITYGNSSGAYNIKDPVTALARQELAAAFFIPVPGPKMIWQFGELGYDIRIDSNGRVGEKPVHWDYLDNAYRKRLNLIYSSLIDLKTSEPAFQTNDFTLNTTGEVKTIELIHSDMNVVIVGNFGITSANYNLNMPGSLVWYDYFEHTRIDLQTNTLSLELQPGEYHLFTSKQFADPEISGINKSATQPFNVLLSPNPWNDKLIFEVKGLKGTKIDVIIYDLSGKIIAKPFSQLFVSSDKEKITWNPGKELTPGMYFVSFKSNNVQQVLKAVKF